MQRWSQLFIPTLREAPADATTASRIYLLRSGYARWIANSYRYLPLGCRSLARTAATLKQQLASVGAQPLVVVTPGSPSDFSSRAAEIALEIRSYKQIPQLWLEFDMRAATLCEFGMDASGASSVWNAIEHAMRLFGVDFTLAKDAPNAIGKAMLAIGDFGNELVLLCENCKYVATRIAAQAKLPAAADLESKGNGLPLEIHTPGQRTIDDVARFLSIEAVHTAKTLTYFAVETDNNGLPVQRPVIALLRGDHQLDEAKLRAALHREIRPMQPSEAQAIFNAPFGSLGPVGKFAREKPLLLVDSALRGRTNLVVGANREDYHFWNVTPERDFVVDMWAELRAVQPGEPCPQCSAPLQERKASRLASAATVDSPLTVLDKDGKQAPVRTASYSIDLESVLAAAIEQHHDDQGFWLEPALAPFDVVVTVVSVRDEPAMQAALQVAEQLEGAGYEVLLDDRDERPGVKFKDADLSGVPFRINVGKKVSEGKVEVFHRSTRTTHDASIAAIKEEVRRG